VHHRLARKESLVDFQLNVVLDTFNRFLNHYHDSGFVILDRLPGRSEYDLMRSKFCDGGHTPWGVPKKWSSILGYASTCDRATHLGTATDVVIGTLGYCVNQRSDQTVPKKLFPMIEPLIWRRREGSSIWVDGLVHSPAYIKVPTYAEEFKDLKRDLRKLVP
jgi:hypothetical protein